MEGPLVSAIVATYNRANTLGQAIESILGQTYKNIEVIVVDDGSTDGTHDVLERFGGRLRILRQENAGPSAARNRGIAEAKGDIISFLDSDDIWLPEKTERQVALLQRAGKSVPCCVCNATLQFTDRPTMTSFQNALLEPAEEEGLWLNPAETLVDHFVLFNQTVAIRGEALEKTGGFDETLRYLEDYDLALRLSLVGVFAFITEPLVIYRQGSAGSLAEEALKKTTQLKENVVRVRERMYEVVRTNDDYAQLRAPVRRALRKAGRELWIARLGQKQIPGASTASRLLERAEHYRGAIGRRLPWYPKMETAPVVSEAVYPSNPCGEWKLQDTAR